MENQNEQIMKQMEETRTSLTEKLEALETQLAGKVQAGADVVERTTEAAAHIVENVKETVHEVTGKVEETVSRVTEKVETSFDSVTDALDIRRQTDRHPWVMVGLATAAGCVLGTMVGRREETAVAAPIAEPIRSHGVRPKHVKGSNGHGQGGQPNGASARATGDESSFWQQGWVVDQMNRMKGLALGTLLGVVRDMAKQSIPGTVGERIAEEIDNFTSHLGAQPIQGPVLPERKDQPDASCLETPATPANRLIPGGPGTGFRG